MGGTIEPPFGSKRLVRPMPNYEFEASGFIIVVNNNKEHSSLARVTDSDA